MLSGTYCHDGVQSTWLEKAEICVKCEVLKQNLTTRNLGKTLRLFAEQFQSYQRQIKEEHQELKETQKKLQEFQATSIYLLKEMERKNIRVLSDQDHLKKKISEQTKELSDIEKKLLQSAKMMAMDRFSAGIAHEINNPLGAIINFVRTVLAHPDIKGENKGYLEMTLKGLFRIESIVREILGYSEKKEPDYKPTRLTQLLKDTVAFVQHRLDDKRIKLVLQVPPRLPLVMLEPASIQHVFINIINNAIDAMSSQGTLKVAASANRRQVQVNFIDDGEGISDEDLDKTFDPFFTTKEVGKGTGLGLFISYNTIKMHKGKIDIASTKGKGTTVAVTLPLNSRG
jgi:two-component system NtrC family sensor kinase